MKQGTSTGVLDEFLATICVGDEIVDKAGTHYTVDRFGRAKPTSGGNELPLKTLEGVTICKSWAGGVVTTIKTAEAAKAKIKAVVDDYFGNKPKSKNHRIYQNKLDHSTKCKFICPAVFRFQMLFKYYRRPKIHNKNESQKNLHIFNDPIKLFQI